MRRLAAVGIAVLDPATAPGRRITLPDIQQLIAERLTLLPPQLTFAISSNATPTWNMVVC